MKWETRENASTDDRGRYRIHGLPAGRYYVEAIKRNGWGRPSQHYAPVLYPGVSRAADAQAIKLSPGEEVGGVKFQLRESPAFSVGGRVVDLRTGHAANATVSLDPQDHSWGDGANSVTVRSDGTFRFTEVVPGNYRVALNVRLGQETLETYRTLDVTDRNIENLIITVSAGATIKGRLVAAGRTSDALPPTQVQLRSQWGPDRKSVV